MCKHSANHVFPHMNDLVNNLLAIWSIGGLGSFLLYCKPNFRPNKITVICVWVYSLCSFLFVTRVYVCKGQKTSPCFVELLTNTNIDHTGTKFYPITNMFSAKHCFALEVTIRLDLICIIF
ncbi:hypothetical protein ACJX0J_035708 [Zea mays]